MTFGWAGSPDTGGPDRSQVAELETFRAVVVLGDDDGFEVVVVVELVLAAELDQAGSGMSIGRAEGQVVAGRAVAVRAGGGVDRSGAQGGEQLAPRRGRAQVRAAGDPV